VHDAQAHLGAYRGSDGLSHSLLHILGGRLRTATPGCVALHYALLCAKKWRESMGSMGHTSGRIIS